MPATPRPISRGFLSAWRASQRVRTKAFTTLAAGGFASFGARNALERPLRLSGEGRIAIGSDVFVLSLIHI